MVQYDTSALPYLPRLYPSVLPSMPFALTCEEESMFFLNCRHQNSRNLLNCNMPSCNCKFIGNAEVHTDGGRSENMELKSKSSSSSRSVGRTRTTTTKNCTRSKQKRYHQSSSQRDNSPLEDVQSRLSIRRHFHRQPK